jgi:hypothetical protein
VQGVVNQVVGSLSGVGGSNPIAPITNLVSGLQNALPTGGNAAGALTGALGTVTGALGNLGSTSPLAPVQGVVNQVVGTLSGAGGSNRSRRSRTSSTACRTRCRPAATPRAR